MRRSIAVFAVIVAGFGAWAAWRGGVAAQVRQPAQDAEVLPALLIEVRGLRVVLEQMASAGPRVQLALGRLQMQEQRVDNVVRRLEAVRAKLVDRQSNYDRLQQGVAGIDESLAQNPQPGQPTSAELKDMQAQFKRETAMVTADIQRFTVEESGLAAELATEQGRWTDLNQRMEELERGLVPR
jgi:chromosome segregation ATPase